MRVVRDKRAEAGRYGDTVLASLNPHEQQVVAGLQALSGQNATYNPHTGLQEAWNIGRMFNPMENFSNSQNVLSGDSSHHASGVPWGEAGTMNQFFRVGEAATNMDPLQGLAVHEIEQLGGTQAQNTDPGLSSLYASNQTAKAATLEEQNHQDEIKRQLQMMGF